jgi:hypothetical protein
VLIDLRFASCVVLFVQYFSLSLEVLFISAELLVWACLHVLRLRRTFCSCTNRLYPYPHSLSIVSDRRARVQRRLHSAPSHRRPVIIRIVVARRIRAAFRRSGRAHSLNDDDDGDDDDDDECGGSVRSRCARIGAAAARRSDAARARYARSDAGNHFTNNFLIMSNN